MPYRHITLFRMHPGVTEAQVAEALAALERLGAETEEPVEWVVARSLDSRKGTVLVENVLFESAEAFQAWRATPQHRATGELMTGLADWIVGDYVDPPGS